MEFAARLGFGVEKVTTELARSYCDPVYDGGSDVEALITNRINDA